MPTTNFDPLTTKIKLDHNDRFTPDRAVNALPIGYKNKPVNLATDQFNAQIPVL